MIQKIILVSRSDARQAKLPVNQQWFEYHGTSLNVSDLGFTW